MIETYLKRRFPILSLPQQKHHAFGVGRNNMKNKSALLGVLGLVSLVLGACNNAPATPTPTPTPITVTPVVKTAAEVALDKAASTKGITGAVTKSSFKDEGVEFKIASFEKIDANGKVEAVMLFEKPDGTFQVNGFSGPSAVSEINADAALNEGFNTELFDADGKLLSAQKLGNVKNELSAEFAWFVYPILRAGAKALIRYYGKGFINNGCNWVVARIRENTGWQIPGWFSQPACNYISWAVVNGIVGQSANSKTPVLAMVPNESGITVWRRRTI
jgi:hypothetical protein